MAKEAAANATTSSCFFCTMKEPDLFVRRVGIISYFRNAHQIDDQELVPVLSGLWSIAMNEPYNEEFPSLGIFEFMANLIEKCVSDRDWLLMNQNIYVPYYAAHIIGSYTMTNARLAVKAVDAGVIPPLLDLLRGNKMSWVEQRVAVRALGHLASYKRTFQAVAEYEDEAIGLAMHLASTCVDVVYNTFVGVEDKRKRLKYQCDLLTRGTGDMDVENRKAEEWASQLQCWCLHLVNCFAIKQRSLDLICNQEFLNELCGMWGRLTNHTSPAAIGLLRILCYSKFGRRRIAESKHVLENLCTLSRSSDDWQYMGIDCLILLLKDPHTRYKVIEVSTLALVDLIELRHIGGRPNIGEAITRTLMSIRLRNYKIKNNEVHQALAKIWTFKLKKTTVEKTLSKEKAEEQRTLVTLIKQQANHRMLLGKIEEAVVKYTEGIELCPLRFRKERVVLYSDRAQCYLLLRNPDAAISDTTRALCLSSPPHSHRKSLWRRSQAYDMKGFARESLMDCIILANCCFKSEGVKQVKIPYCAVRMICKQMESTWLFKGPQLKTLKHPQENQKHPQCDDDFLQGLEPNLKGI